MKQKFLHKIKKLHTFALGNKCKIYESDKLIKSLKKGEMSHT